MSSRVASSFLVGLALVVVACGGGGGNGGGSAGGGNGGDTASEAPTPTTSAPSAVPSPTEARSSPRWEPVTTIAGEGPTQPPPFEIVADAIQWRVRWSCDSGTLRMTTTPAPRRPAPIVESDCPGQGEGFAILTGSIRVDVEASGPWEGVVEQQVDGPLDEPPPPGAADGSVLAQGDFYEVENPGSGRALILELADGQRVLRLEDFETLATADLFVWLTHAPEPRTTVEAVDAEGRVELGPLRSTLGNQNYELPADLDIERIGSVVIWCEPVSIVYTAAALAATSPP